MGPNHNFTKSAKTCALASLCAAATSLWVITPAHAQSTNGGVGAEVVGGVTLQSTQGMDFGTIIPGTARTKIRIDPDDASTTVLGDALLVGGTVTTGDFRVTGTANERVRITISEIRIDLVRDGGTETMRVDRFRLDGNRNRSLNAAGEAAFSVGGQLSVEPNQASGVYRGTFNVSVDYF